MVHVHGIRNVTFKHKRFLKALVRKKIIDFFISIRLAENQTFYFPIPFFYTKIYYRRFKHEYGVFNKYF